MQRENIYFLKIFFKNVDHFQSQFVTILLLFMFWFFGHRSFEILAPWPGIKPSTPASEGEVLTIFLYETVEGFVHQKIDREQHFLGEYMYQIIWCTCAMAILEHLGQVADGETTVSVIVLWDFHESLSVKLWVKNNV